MLIGPELAGWCADAEAQNKTQHRIEAFAAGWRAGAVHRGFGRAMGALDDPSAEAVAKEVLRLFADDLWLGTLVGGLAEALREDPFFEPPFPALSSDIHNGLLVYEDRHVSIAAGVTRADELAAKKNVARGRVSIGFTGYVSVLKFVSAGDACLSFWEAPPITDEFTASAAGVCRRTGTRIMRDGDTLVCDGRRESYVIEHARSNMLLLQATVKADQAPLAIEYDAASHDYVGCSATSDVSSRIQMLTTLLRKLGDGRAFEAIAAFIDHPDFFVRWHVMRELLGIDARAALPHLENMAAWDPHPDVRASAAAVLGRLPTPTLRKAA